MVTTYCPAELAPAFAGLECIALVEFDPPVHAIPGDAICLAVNKQNNVRGELAVYSEVDVVIKHEIKSPITLRYGAIYSILNYGGYAGMFFESISLEPKP